MWTARLAAVEVFLERFGEDPAPAILGGQLLRTSRQGPEEAGDPPQGPGHRLAPTVVGGHRQPGLAGMMGLAGHAVQEQRPAGDRLAVAVGGQAQGGVDALFQPATLEDRSGSEATSRWSMEAAYGFPAFGGRWTGSPHVGLGLATGAWDYSIGWRLTPEGRTAATVSLGLKATRRESGIADPEHTAGLEVRAAW